MRETLNCGGMPHAKTVSLRLPGQSYDIRVEPGLLAEVGIHLAASTEARRAFVVTDDTVGPLHADCVIGALRSSGFDAHRLDLPAGETHKTLATVSLIYDALLAQRIERSSLVIG